MSEQILFCRKNHIDLDRVNSTITITDAIATNTGQDSVDFLRNRNNISGWLTTDSTDAANTVILSSFGGDFEDVDYISLIRHNFKDYLVEWQDSFDVWATYVNVASNTKSTNVHQLTTPVNAKAIRITVTAMQTLDEDKEMRQLIITEKKFKLVGWPVIKKPVHSRNRKNNKMLSGKINVVDTQGAFSVDLSIKLTGDDNDLSIHEDLYDQIEGLLLLLSGGDEDQFQTKRRGYRNEDIVLVKTINEYTNPYYKGQYISGIKVLIKLAEVIF